MSLIVKHLVRPEHLNGANALFGGTLLAWVDEATAIAAIEKVGSVNVATVAMSNVVFERPVHRGDLVRIAVKLIAVGNTSLTFRVKVTKRGSRKPVINVEKIVYVSLDEDGRPRPHGVKKISCPSH
ncbi:MAG: acyl-CoA thioesterase [bacterium]|nr:acyl-CoA thioesterase [bacterium]